ncbi:hypothetical protein MMC14_006304 [Varicellaria rhodocarpa]|nr:hypothetical protein [Varicellaria rhodocarpa]
MNHVANVKDGVHDDKLWMERQVLVMNIVLLQNPPIWRRYGSELEKIGAAQMEQSLAKMRDGELMQQREMPLFNFPSDRPSPGEELELEGYDGLAEARNLQLQGQALLDTTADGMMVFERLQPESIRTTFQNNPPQLPLPQPYQDDLRIYIPRMPGAVPNMDAHTYYESVLQVADSRIQDPWENIVFDGQIYHQAIKDGFVTSDGRLFFLFSRNTNIFRVMIIDGPPARIVYCEPVETICHPVMYQEDGHNVIQFKCVEDGFPRLWTF